MPELFTTGAALFESFAQDVWHGEAPERWPLGAGPLGEHIDFGPGELVLIGGAPGAGKTALATGAAFDAVRSTPDLRLMIANVEMAPAALLNRLLARLSGVRLEIIQKREANKLGEVGRQRIQDGLTSLGGCIDRVAFLEAPYSIDRVASAADAFGARCLVLDYIQRIAPPEEKGSQRENLEAIMASLRRFTQAGAGVIALSAVARQKANGGGGYDGLGMASFRGSSELEFAADSCYTLAPTDEKRPELVTLKCHKRRNGEPRDIPLHFERPYQRFIDAEQTPAPAPAIEGSYEDDDTPF